MPGKVKSLERRTEGWRVGLRDKDTVDSDRSKEDSESSGVMVVLRGSGSVWRRGVSLNTVRSPEASVAGNKSPWLSIPSNPTPDEAELVFQPDRGGEG